MLFISFILYCLIQTIHYNLIESQLRRDAMRVRPYVVLLLSTYVFVGLCFAAHVYFSRNTALKWNYCAYLIVGITIFILCTCKTQYHYKLHCVFGEGHI